MILYGTGIEAEYWIYNNIDAIQKIRFCIDKNRDGVFHNIPIYKTDEIAGDIDRETIVVAAGDYTTFKAIGRELDKRGLEEWKNYVWSKTYNKKLVVINANCHGDAIVRYLMTSNKFRRDYFVYPYVEIQNNVDGALNEELLKRADVYIHQDIRSDNAIGYKLSDEYVRTIIRRECVDICIPNMVGLGNWLFPNLKGLDKPLKNVKGDVLDYVLYRDAVIDEAVEKGLLKYEEIKKYWDEYRIPEKMLQDEYLKFIEKIQIREQNWTIKVGKYIIDNFTKTCMFSDGNHPSTEITKRICKEVAERLEIKDAVEDGCKYQLGIPVPMLPCVRAYFNISYEEKHLDSNIQYLKKEVENPLYDYIRAYVWWYHGMII